ncbi:DUF4148 domain-containing protein [Polaromonas sp. JS666]|uniref:DUF4148 domain-containing protein n=1 Tax=Polaromonas sp. (strain JS666 / ATCC BAA-500) TaxID=296591 RepID=UPI00088544B2|nr:DUF4148 domain-containing protein [Polaromonas sp. JS666]SDO08311.1 protein of unknown function [Polaromonas sp. JS666]
MKSNLVSASVLAVSALAFFGSASSFAEGRDPFAQDQVKSVSTKTRAEVKAELAQAQREGYSVNIGRTYQDVYSAPASSKTRAEVKAEIGTTVSASALDRDFPVVQ